MKRAKRENLSHRNRIRKHSLRLQRKLSGMLLPNRGVGRVLPIDRDRHLAFEKNLTNEK